MKKSLVSVFVSLLLSNPAFGMGTSAVLATATAVVTATSVVTALPSQTTAGTLNPPEVIYEDEKVKVEKEAR